MITVLYELTASTDVPVLEGVNNDLLRDMLNALATDACNWVSACKKSTIHMYTFSSSQVNLHNSQVMPVQALG